MSYEEYLSQQLAAYEAWLHWNAIPILLIGISIGMLAVWLWERFLDR